IVLASVIGRRPEKGLILIDAGALALSLDRSTAALEQDLGYGLVFDALARAPIAELRVARVNQEHGMVEGTGGAALPFDALPAGARVRVLPNHACMTAAMFDRYHVTDGGDEVVAEWPRCNGW
ncbi:MAG: DSD1 family PLP-dependent enzyme, partial [Alphaproteobacteria bacterium]|nr:DSD1 family PLP-dependent enzyme [Alphaproteobacteria bacterium]